RCFSNSVTLTSATSDFELEPQTAVVAATKVFPFRDGHVFDLHHLEPEYPLIIGGINISHDRDCEVHCDDDVFLQCVVDAILGVLGLSDTGKIFSDTDPKWEGTA
ncbi:2-c-methyl-d-erythritol 2 4-cyclodiphosphate synthase chloroplastic, partial [Phtheirospermum japonicum]